MGTRAVVLLGLAIVLAQVGLFLVLAGGDVSRLVHAAAPFTAADSAPASLTVGPPETGFDGQFFYRQAQEPLSDARQVEGVTFDLSALRSARITYPLLASALSLGQQALLPWALVGVNVVMAGLLVAAFGTVARDAGRHPAWGLVAVAYPGFVYTIGFDLAELTASALLVVGLVAVRRQEQPPS